MEHEVLLLTVLRDEYDISKIITFSGLMGSNLADYIFEATFQYNSDQISHFP